MWRKSEPGGTLGARLFNRDAPPPESSLRFGATNCTSVTTREDQTSINIVWHHDDPRAIVGRTLVSIDLNRHTRSNSRPSTALPNLLTNSEPDLRSILQITADTADQQIQLTPKVRGTNIPNDIKLTKQTNQTTSKETPLYQTIVTRSLQTSRFLPVKTGRVQKTYQSTRGLVNKDHDNSWVCWGERKSESTSRRVNKSSYRHTPTRHKNRDKRKRETRVHREHQ